MGALPPAKMVPRGRSLTWRVAFQSSTMKSRGRQIPTRMPRAGRRWQMKRQMLVTRISTISTGALLWVACLAPKLALAQTDEIQVYNAEIASPGELTLTLHNN